ncbi:MAG: type I polyketide synthase [Paracoccaceae bacterium]
MTGDIAIVGLSVCVPGAQSLSDFWANLRDGIESIDILDETDLKASGEHTERLSDPNYVRAAARLEGFDTFDADFFGFSPKEAAILDPQHRKFLEVAWEAMEIAGHPPETILGPVGVYAGCGMGSYFYFNICSNPELVDDVGMFLLRHTGNDKDFLSTRVSHVFDLTGPSLNIQTACSTSLVAVHYACDALRRGEVEMALAGGVTIELPQGRGYLYKENEILSPDGHCHAFDHRAQGTVFGSGAGAVALRRLEDAVADGDHIWAVIKGSAVNNDGASKAGYLAPSVEGQSAAVRQALRAAEVSADSIGYVECHGTGTYLGDPIEVSALSEAYRDDTSRAGFCRIGSIKTNIGHLDTAAGIAGLAKTALALHHQKIPPSLNFEAPNPAIDFESSPFQVNATLSEWPDHTGPARAAVNALGVGGTNAHMVMEEAPDRSASDESDFPFHIICLSALSKKALDQNSDNLGSYLRTNPDVSLADVAFTLKEGRRGFERRRILVAETATEAAALLENPDPRRVFDHVKLGDAPDVVFMFPGGGAQYPGMARDLYETEPVFADWMDRGLEHLQANLDYDIRALWLPEPGEESAAAQQLTRPSAQLPLIMIIEYALAQLWMSWGVKPASLVGHSMGENVAACLAGVLSFEDCIDLVHLRGRLFDTVPAGGMLSVPLAVDEVRDLMGDALDIASVNAPELTAVSGPQNELDKFAELLANREVDCQRIQIDIAAHSRMLEPILQEYGNFLSTLRLYPPKIAILSNRTGIALTAEQATDPSYWVAQLRNTVNFADCIGTLADRDDRVFLEVGPGKALSALASMHPSVKTGQVLSSLRHPDQDFADDAYFLEVIGRLWACGVNADWAQIWGDAKRHRLPLPTYAFQRSRYFIEPGKPAILQDVAMPERKADLADWGYKPVWKPALAQCALDIETELDASPLRWLFFMDNAGFAAPAADRLEAAGHTVIRVAPGDMFSRSFEYQYSLAPEQGVQGYESLLQDLASRDMLPDRIAHFWLVTQQESFRPGASFFDRNLEMGFHSLTHLAQAMGSVEIPETCQLTCFTTGAAKVRGEALPYPEKAMIAGPAGVIPREFPGVSCAWIDVELPKPSSGIAKILRGAEMPEDTPRLIEELVADFGNTRAAWRGSKRFELDWRPINLPEVDKPMFKQGGTYLITGGYGGIGLTVAAHLLREYEANVVLISRDGLPAREDWDRTRKTHSPAHRLVQRIRAAQGLLQIGRGQLLTLAADVCNSDQMRNAMNVAQDQFGTITGVFHGAGEIDDSPILGKSDSSIARVFAPKVSGLRVLDALFPDGSIEQMVLFASSSTVTTPAGQVDYVAANEYLNAFAQHRKGGETDVLAVNWGVWSDVGMAADAVAARQGRKPSEFTPCDQPLLDTQGFDRDGNPVFKVRLDEDSSWVMSEHRTSLGQALLPGTGYIELAAEALKAQGIDEPFELRDLYFFRPLVAGTAGHRDVVVRLHAHETGYALSIYSEIQNEAYVLNAQAQVMLNSDTPRKLALDKILSRCPLRKDAGAGSLRSPQEAHLDFGPRWRVLKETSFGTNEGLARLRLPNAAIGDGCMLHPGLMDLATGWAISLVPDYTGQSLWVPVAYDSIGIHASLPADISSYVRLTEGSGDGFARFDITLSDSDGTICVEIKGFQMKRLEGQLDLSDPDTADATASELGLTEESQPDTVSPAERRLRHNISQGIRGAEGAEALVRGLATGRSQIVISSLDLNELRAQAGLSDTTQPVGGQSFERPDLDTDFIAPRNSVEETVAGLFANLLGLAVVGIEDSFFDVGGHSLIAVRLFAQVKRQFDVEFPISVLFEAPTVSGLSEMIIARTGGGVSSDPADMCDPDEPQQEATRLKHLVKLHPGDGTGKRPFFLVAGMFGNVLNLRQLALLVGQDRPVYGLQARGLIGEEAPHHSLHDAARDYLSEIQQVQPVGPYHLGGFSGGGITAFDMAQQLSDIGETVASLILLDTPLPLRPALFAKDKALIKLQEIRRKGVSFFAEWMKNRVLWEFEKRRPSGQPTGQSEFNNQKIETAFRHALDGYKLQAWDGSLTLFRPPLDRNWAVSDGRYVSAAREYVFDDNDWSRWAPQIEVVEVPGDHDSMVLVPNVSVLADHVRAVLDRSDPAPAASVATAAE